MGVRLGRLVAAEVTVSAPAPPEQPASGATDAPPLRRPPGRLRRTLGGLVWVVAVVAGLAAGLTTFVLMASLSDQPAVLGMAVFLVGLVLTVAVGALAALVSGRRRGAARVVRTAVVAAIVVATGAGTALSWPLTRDVSAPRPGPDVRYWDLPTGSRLAYYEYPARSAAAVPTPILFLHGGPGGPLRSFEFDFFPQFARDGFDVYLFEQAGVGGSRALPSAGDYTAERAVEDVEAVRRTIGAQQVILIGQSWGGELAALYTAAHPDRVAKLVLTEPGGLPQAAAEAGGARAGQAGPGSAPGAGPDLYTPRFLAAALLAQVNPRAAENFASADELNHYMDLQVPRFISQSFCARDAAQVPPIDVQGFNFYANVVAQTTAGLIPDPRPALRRSPVPTLVMRGECSYVPWPDTYSYTRVLPQAELVYVPGAGHVLWAGQPGPTAAAIRAFLLGRDLPVAPYRGIDDPAAVPAG